MTPYQPERPFAASPFEAMLWGPSSGRFQKRPYEPTPFEPMDTPYRARRAAGYGAAAAGIIAGLHLLSACYTLFGRGGPAGVWIGDSPALLGSVQLALAGTAAALALRIGRAPTVRSCGLVLAWSALELVPPLTYVAYGHAAGGPWTPLAWMGAGLAVLGLRGALALRRQAAAGG